MERSTLPAQENAIFSIYRTQDAIELRMGCENCDHARFISAHKSYENAHASCQALVEEMGLPLNDLAGDRASY